MVNTLHRHAASQICLLMRESHVIRGAEKSFRLIPGRANYAVAVNGHFHHVSGTSVSAPVVGSMIAMINDARLAVGKGPVGELLQYKSQTTWALIP